MYTSPASAKFDNWKSEPYALSTLINLVFRLLHTACSVM